ncbi:GNAT family N-acetyltransferase [Ruegeria sp. 6PALISEP08]|uniref:GNAT family N-acetyltransferase n=1 Tax=Ruegeria sp. 6PALISEP08 TaxID=1225660 RepID=UPI00067E940E|nr:GNAT family N-acetyltransferase [Ruegeria sp. 6PALISEP08]
MNFDIEVTQDLPSCFALRHQVFVLEQGVPVSEEQDALDNAAIHLLARDVQGPLGTARIVCDRGTAKIGRVCVLARARGQGLGADLIRKAVDLARADPEINKVKLGAQTHAVRFYEKLGFTPLGPVYLDAGIEHRDMVRDLP